MDNSIYITAMKENMVTVLAAAICVSGVAFATDSFHCFWGLIILINLNKVDFSTTKNNES